MIRRALVWILAGVLLVTGVAFIPGTLGASARLAVEVAFGADLTASSGTWSWTDVTADVRHNPGVSITIGRQDEVSTTGPAGCTFTLANSIGAYTPYNALGSNYPNVRRGTPVRVRVTLDGSTWRTRFQGYADTWSPTWDTSGKLASVVVSASGVLRRLSQGATPLKTPLVRSILSSASTAVLRQYWPCDDGSQATQCTSALAGGTPLVTTGTVEYGGMDWTHPQTGGITLLPGTTFGTGPVVRLTQGGKQNAAFTGGSSSAWTVQAAVYVDPITNNAALTLFRWTDTTGRVWEVVSDGITTGSVRLVVNGATVATHTHIIFNEDIRIDASQSGGNVNWSFKPALAYAAITGSFAGTLGAVNTWVSNPANAAVTGDFSVAHVRVWDGNTAPNFKTSTLALSAWNGYKGEAPDARISRLCAEEDVPYARVDYYTTRQAMGPQPVASLLTLLRECEAADAGFLYDGLSDGLRYQGISQRFDQSAAMTLDASAGDILPPFVPVDSDQRLRNRVTASRAGGSTVVAEDVVGPLGTATVGVYDTSVTVNLIDDSMLDDRAGWELHAGTREGFRYPSLSINPGASSSLASRWMTTTNGWTGPIAPGWRIDVTNVEVEASQHPAGTISLCMEGYTEQISPVSWLVSLNLSQQDVYDVWKVGDATKGRVGTNGHTLTNTIPAGTGTELCTADPTFESGVTGWSATAGTVASSTAQHHTGSKSALLTANGTGQAYIRTATVSATAGAWYYLSFWVYSTAGYSSVGCSIDWQNGAGYLSTSTVAAALPAGVWTRYTCAAQAPATTTGAKFGPTLGGAPANGTTLYVDDLSFVAVARFTTPTGVPLWTTAAADFPLYVNIGGIKLTVSEITGTSSPQTAVVSGVTKALSSGAAVSMWKNGVVRL